MTRWLNPEERAVWVRLAAVMERLPGVLETQLTRDSHLSHYEYWVLAMLSEAPEGRRRMSDLAALTSATLPRLSHVVQRLEARGLVKRVPCKEDGRAIHACITADGLRAIEAAAPGHVEEVRERVIDALTEEQLTQMTASLDAILRRLGPDAVAIADRLDAAAPIPAH